MLDKVPVDERHPWAIVDENALPHPHDHTDAMKAPTGLLMDTKAAVATLSAAFKADPGYATAWHANIAMAMFDALPEDTPNKHRHCNEAAAAFMKLAFGVTSGNPFP